MPVDTILFSRQANGYMEPQKTFKSPAAKKLHALSEKMGRAVVAEKLNVSEGQLSRLIAGKRGGDRLTYGIIVRAVAMGIPLKAWVPKETR